MSFPHPVERSISHRTVYFCRILQAHRPFCSGGALQVLFMVITLTSLISDEISCAYFVLFMSLILLLVFPPFFPVACLFIWKTFIPHHFKDKRWNTGARILNNLAEYTVVLSHFLSRAHLGFVSHFKRAVAHHAANVNNAPRQLKGICGTEKSILKKKKARLLWWPQWQQITLAERRRTGPTSVHDKIHSPWQRASGRGERSKSPALSRATLSHSPPRCPSGCRSLSLAESFSLQSTFTGDLPHNRHLQINQMEQWIFVTS